MCFLDAKKAFDRVNHWTLAKNLLDRNAPWNIVKLFIFWYREQEFVVGRWGNSSMTFGCSNVIRQSWQLSPLLYNVYTDDLNYHLHATGVGYYVWGAWVNSLSYADDMVLLAPMVTALGGMSRMCWTSWHCIQHNENSMCAGPTKEITGSVLNKSHARKWGTFIFCGVSLPTGHVIPADCRDDKVIKKQFRRQKAVSIEEVLICTYSGKNLIVRIILLPHLWMCSLASFIPELYSIRKLTVSYSDTFKRLINVPSYTSSSLAFTMNATDHINVVFRKFAYSLMSRVTASPYSTVFIAIVNSDANHQSLLMDKWESMLYV